MMVADLILDLSFEELERRFLAPYRQGIPMINKGKTITKDNIGHIRMYTSEKILGDKQRSPHRLGDIANEITDRLITGPPGLALEATPRANQERRPETPAQEVFVVHGRNDAARDALFSFLRALNLSPLEWSEAVQATGKPSPYIGEILETAFSRAHAVVVLFTPDDEARLRESFWTNNELSYETELTGQARPNVLFEAGMAMAGSQDRTILVELGTLRPFSDIAGHHTIRLDNSPQRRQDLAKRLQNAGCPVNLDGTDWYSTGDFEATVEQLVQVSSDSAAVVEQQSTSADPLQLSEEAKELLAEAAKDNSGMILVIRTMGGLVIKTNGKGFGESGNKRSEARWKQAIRDLLDQGLVEDRTSEGKTFEVTHKGFEITDGIVS